MRESKKMYHVAARAVTCIAILVVLLAARRLDACSCTEGEAPCSQWSVATDVFEGTVDSIQVFPLENVITLRNVKAWRGRPQTTIVTRTSGGSCGYEFFKVGERYLIAPYRDMDGRLQATGCGSTRPLKGAEGILTYLATLNGPPNRTHVFGNVSAVTSTRNAEVPSPVAGARVTLRGPSDLELVSDAAGDFAVSGIPHGYYSASVQIPGSNVVIQDVGFQLSALTPHACAAVKFIHRTSR